MRFGWMVVGLGWLVGCDDGGSAEGGGDAAGPAVDVGADAVLADGAPDAGDPTLVPLIGEVLTCGTRAEVGGVPRGEDLARFDLDLARFPDALCNDGSGAVFYFRPFAGEANRNKWVIQLKGGGGCESGESCGQRWCSVLTLFGQSQMVNDINRPPLPTIGGRGILERRPENPWSDYNHVFIQYCSSDGWAGTGRDVVYDTFHPCEPTQRNARCPDGSACPAEGEENAGLCVGSPVRFRAHFLGRRIIDAVIDTLRQEGGPGPAGLPDLDEAQHVVLAGASAGGAGVTHNLDRVAESLRRTNTACQGGACPLEVDGIIDSIFGPSLVGLDVTHTANCPPGMPELCGVEDYLGRVLARQQSNPQQLVTDESCVAWHMANEPGTEWQCAELSHIISHHITTPVFVRMGLVDQLLMSSFLELGVHTGDGEPIDMPLEFATVLHPQLEWFSEWATEAEEADPALTPPGVFAPGCPKHETLSEEAAVYGTFIEAMGAPRSFFDVWRFWKEGGAPAVLVADTPEDSTCP